METRWLAHYGIKGQQWGVRRYQNADGSFTEEGRKRAGERVFVSGTSKMQDKKSKYYRKNLPKEVSNELDNHMKKDDTILVGDAPGVDSMVQDYLANKKYKNVEIYVTGDNVRKNSDDTGDLGWKVNHIDGSKYEEGSKEWHAVKDKAMNDSASSGLSVILENNGASATRKNIQRFLDSKKDVKIFELNSNKGDSFISTRDFLEEMNEIQQGENMNDNTQWLAHHGVKGQKWGVRRYQNADGSLTEEGKKKYMSMRPNELGNELHKAIAEERKYRPYSDKYYDIGKNSQKDRENYSVEEKEFEKSLEEKYGKKAWKDYVNAYEDPDKYDDYEKTLETNDKISRDYSQFYLDQGRARIMGQKLSSKALRRIGKTNIAYLKDLGFNDETSRLLNSKIIKADTKFVDIQRRQFSDEFI